MGIPTGFSVGMGWVLALKFNPHGSPDNNTQYLTQRQFLFNIPLFQTNITSQMWPSGGKGVSCTSLIQTKFNASFTAALTNERQRKIGLNLPHRFKSVVALQCLANLKSGTQIPNLSRKRFKILSQISNLHFLSNLKYFKS